MEEKCSAVQRDAWQQLSENEKSALEHAQKYLSKYTIDSIIVKTT
jgi:hypothetical protein